MLLPLQAPQRRRPAAAGSAATSEASGAAVAGAGAAAAAIGSRSSDAKKKNKEEPQRDVSSEESCPNSYTAEAVDSLTESDYSSKEFQEHVRTVSDEVSRGLDEQGIDTSASSDNRTFTDELRIAGSALTHEIVDSVDKLFGDIPVAVEPVRQALGPDQSALYTSASPVEDFESMIATGHEWVDNVFSTDIAKHYTPEAKEQNILNNTAIAILPPPSLGVLGRVGGAARTRALARSSSGRIAPTLASDACGWRVGQDITNRTLTGRVPRWNTVRQRYWKNEAHKIKQGKIDSSSSYELSERNINRMSKGKAPQRLNPDTGKIESMELHHQPPQRDGGLFDVTKVWPDEHADLDSYRKVGG